jgi:hypothetical protein
VFAVRVAFAEALFARSMRDLANSVDILPLRLRSDFADFLCHSVLGLPHLVKGNVNFSFEGSYRFVPASLTGDSNIAQRLVSAATFASHDLHTFLQDPTMLVNAAAAVGSFGSRLLAVADFTPHDQYESINQAIVTTNPKGVADLAGALAVEFVDILDNNRKRAFARLLNMRFEDITASDAEKFWSANPILALKTLRNVHFHPKLRRIWWRLIAANPELERCADKLVDKVLASTR